MNLRKLTVEFIGTFFFVLTICLTAYSAVPDYSRPLAIGSVLVGMIYAGGYISGAMFNPAITLAFFLRNKIDLKETAFYIGTQFLGGVAAAGVVLFLTSANPAAKPLVTPPQYFGIFQTLCAELIGSFGLAWVIMNLASTKNESANHFYGLAIGMTVTGLVYTLSAVSSGVFNPAVEIAINIARLGNWSNAWIYLVGSFVGAASAGFAFKFMNPEE
jgi:aquaporin Z